MSVLDERTALATPIGELYTEEDLEQMPSGKRYELIRGELCAMPNNSAEHGNKTMRLSIPVGYFIEENDLGECFAAETRFTLAKDPDITLAPDFAFIAKERLTNIPPKGYLHLAPDLVIETRSPGDTRTEFALKITLWLQAGVRVVWALDPASRSLTVHRTGAVPVTLTMEDTLSGEDVVPGFTLPLRRVFREIAPGTPPR
jgi:Uma2 family endonuclease